MKKQGFILVTVMCLLLILTILTLGTLETSLLLTKQVNAQWRYWQASVAVTNSNNEWIKALTKDQNLKCIHALSDNDPYWHQHAVQWALPSCDNAQAAMTSRTVIESFPENTCFITDEGKKAGFFRLTTEIFEPPNIQLKVQSVVAIAYSSSLPAKTCLNTLSQISLGIQSWRME